MAAGNPLNEELRQEILSIDGITDVIAKRQSLHASYTVNEFTESGMCDMLTEQNYSLVEAALVEGTMPTDTRSILVDSSTSKRDNIPAGTTVAFTFGQSSVPVTVAGVFDNTALPNGHGALAFDAPLEYRKTAFCVPSD